MALIYKIVSATEWREAEVLGHFAGSAVDRRDGFIHLSAESQVQDTAARHFSGMTDLLLVAVDGDAVAITWEPSRGGALFPHIYGPLPLHAVRSVVPLGPDGRRSSDSRGRSGVGMGSDPGQ
jgi:uncharacterized protein (DUF952 family)